MKTYRYTAYDLDGRIISASIKASEKSAAVKQLVRDGLTVARISEMSQKTAWLNKDIRFSNFGLEDKVFGFTRALSELVSAEIKIDDALRIIRSHSKNDTKAICDEILAKVGNGDTLSQAIELQSGFFRNEYIELIRVGEQSGNLSTALVDLTALLERRLDIRRKIISALTYPMLVAGVSIVTIAAVVEILIPSITPIFIDNHKPLPGIVWFVLYVRANNASIILGFVLSMVVCIASVYFFGRQRAVQLLALVTLKIPIVSSYIEERDTCAFLRLFGVLHRAGVPLLTSLSSSCKNIRNTILKSRMERVIEDIRQGSKIAGALQRQKALPETAVHFINVGEETGKLATMVLRAADLFERQYQRKLDRLVALMTPALTLGLSGFVGLLIMSVMNALLGINSIVSHR